MRRPSDIPLGSRAWILAAMAVLAGVLLWRIATPLRRGLEPAGAARAAAPKGSAEGGQELGALARPELAPLAPEPARPSAPGRSPGAGPPTVPARDARLEDLEGDAWVLASRKGSISRRLEEFRAKPTIGNADGLVHEAVFARMDLMGTSEVHPSGVTVETDHPVDRDHLQATSLLGNDEVRVYAYSRQEFPLLFVLNDLRFYSTGKFDAQSSDPEAPLEPHLAAQVIAEAEYALGLLERR